MPRDELPATCFSLARDLTWTGLSLRSSLEIAINALPDAIDRDEAIRFTSAYRSMKSQIPGALS